MPFKFSRTKIKDILLIEPICFEDSRGFFLETYKLSDFNAGGINARFVQDNRSRSKKNVLRGLHYQTAPFCQAKLVTCLSGSILDVAVDLRRSSEYFGQWIATELSEADHTMLYIPEGFAHGFVTLSDFADVLYKVTADYSRECERGIIWNDPQIAIDWPLAEPILSIKDQSLPFLGEADLFA
jgi:dTDP-4-dehydrorhamnose 3,5-epimerase